MTDDDRYHEEREARGRRAERRDRWAWTLTVATLLVVMVASALYVIHADRQGRERDRVAALRDVAACKRGEDLRAYVRVDNDFAVAFLESLDPSTLTPAQRAVRTGQLEARATLLATGAFDKGQCEP